MSTSEDSLKETGRGAAAAIVEMVAALECDYDRLEELRGEKQSLVDSLEESTECVKYHHGGIVARNPEFTECRELLDTENALGAWTTDNAEELAELEEAAGECKDREEAEQRIQEDALSVEMRGDWYTYDTEPADAAKPVEFKILLTTGGPAVRIMGELDESGQPDRAWLEVQDWGTPWTRYFDIEQDTLLAYARCFYFGEG